MVRFLVATTLLLSLVALAPATEPATTGARSTGLILERHGRTLLLANILRFEPAFEMALPDDCALAMGPVPIQLDELHKGMYVRLIRNPADRRLTLYAWDSGLGIVQDISEGAVHIKHLDQSLGDMLVDRTELHYVRFVAPGQDGARKPVSALKVGMLVAPYYVTVPQGLDRVVRGLLIVEANPSTESPSEAVHVASDHRSWLWIPVALAAAVAVIAGWEVARRRRARSSAPPA